MKILIVEDEIIQATSLKFQLVQLGYKNITIADNGITANKQMEQQDFDLIFCDIRMPHMNGITLLSEYLKPEKVQGVVIMSAVDDDILGIVRGMCNLINMGYVDLLKKPFDKQLIEQVLTSFKDYLTKKSDVIDEIEVVELRRCDIESAFENDRLFPMYQPQFDYRNGKLVGVEALARYEHPEFGLISPAEFLPLVNDMGLMSNLYQIILDKATSAMASLNAEIQLAVNIEQQILQEDICDLTISICSKNGFSPNLLTLELTEVQAYSGTPTAFANLAQLRLHDVKLSVDDFGTGYASLDKLIDLPFTSLKIDRNFIKGITTDYKRQQITRLSLQLAQSLGMNCVSEGVEDLETWEFLRELGVDICQGFHTGKPMSIQELISEVVLLRDHRETTEINPSLGKMVLIWCNGTLSFKALSQLLFKELSENHVITTSSEAEFSSILRDLPISFVITDEKNYISSELFIEDSCKNENRRFTTLVVNDSKSKVYKNESREAHYIKEGSIISETVKSISELINFESKSNEKSQYYNDLLSNREQDVLRLLLAGFTNKYIAYELNLNQKTVSTYKTRILTKLNAKSTVEIIRKLDLN